MSREFVRMMPSHQQGGRRASLLARLHIDLPLLVGLMLIAGGGLMVLFSASDENLHLMLKQLLRFGVGFTGLFIIAQIPPRTLRFWTPLFYGIALVLLVLVELVGITNQGAQRWLMLPVFGQFQPAELMKIGMPMMLAWYFHSRPLPPRFKHVVVSLVLMAVPVVLVALQPDLGTALLILFSGVAVLFLAGLSWRIIFAAFLLLLIIAPLMYFFVLHDYQQQRILTFLHPEADRLGAGWNIIQSKTAIGSGGVFGKGWLEGTQSRLDFLPESSTDFIFAVLGEEFGLLGFLVLLSGYLFVVSRCLWISFMSQGTHERLLSSTLAFTFFIYAFINIGMVSGILPVVGVPLPLVSYGGTSAVTLLAGFGIIMSIGTHRRLLK